MLHCLRLVIPFLLIAALAFGYRVIIMSDRATAQNEVSDWDPLPEGSDQRTYFHLLNKLQSGEYPPERFYYQPGIVYILGAATALLQTNDLLALRLFFAALSALNCGFIAYLTWRMTDRRNAGYTAGLVLALYPVGACYDTDFVITSQAVIIATLMMSVTWQSRNRPLNLATPLLVGFLTGVGAVTRFELVAAGGACALWLFYQRRDALGLRQIALVITGALFVIAPVALHNRAGGANYLITPVGSAVVHLGNSRDADGTASPSNAEDSTRVDHMHYLAQDIALEPERFIQLVLHKVALFFSSIEPGNNLDFRRTCEGISTLLLLNPLNFSVVLVLTLAGLTALWRDGHRSLVQLLLIGGCAYCLAVILGLVISRVKTPVVIWMLPAAGYAVDQGIAVLFERRLRTVLRRNWLVLPATALLLLAIHAGATELPKDVTVSALPPDATHAGLRFDDTLELVGWQVREQYSPRNTIQPFHPWVVSLYWRLLQPTEVDYTFSLKYFIEEKALLEYDRPIGYTVYPRDYTSQWQVDVIYVEHIGLTWRGFTGPFEKTGRVVLDVYPERYVHRRFTPQDSGDESASPPVLARPAILLDQGQNRVAVWEPAVAFGEELLLLGYEMPSTGEPNEHVHVHTAWQTGLRQIEAAYAIGVYLFHNDDFLSNSDGAPSNGALQTFSLLPDYRFDDEKTLTLPSSRGKFDVMIGVYDIHSMERLPVAGTNSNLHHIGSVTVR